MRKWSRNVRVRWIGWTPRAAATSATERSSAHRSWRSSRARANQGAGLRAGPAVRASWSSIPKAEGLDRQGCHPVAPPRERAEPTRRLHDFRPQVQGVVRDRDGLARLAKRCPGDRDRHEAPRVREEAVPVRRARRVVDQGGRVADRRGASRGGEIGPVRHEDKMGLLVRVPYHLAFGHRRPHPAPSCRRPSLTRTWRGRECSQPVDASPSVGSCGKLAPWRPISNRSCSASCAT